MNLNKNGFTFFEITLVIVLIGLLAALVAPMYLDLRSKARDEKVNQTALAITNAAILGYMENIVKGNSPAYPPTPELRDRISLSGIELNWVDSGNCATADIDGQAYSFLYDQSTGFTTVENGKGSCKPAKKKKK
jgi:prepilin-type N-terminal cleavage/methylation domain-containing protein